MSNLIIRAFEKYRNEGLLSLINSTVSYLENRFWPTEGTLGIIKDQGFFGLINRLYHTNFFRNHNSSGVNWFNQDWDNLILLDACRYDKAAKMIEFDGTLESRESLGSASPESISANLRNQSLPDTVIVSANGFYQYFDERNEFNFNLHDMYVVEHTDVWENKNLSGSYDDRHERVWLLQENMNEIVKQVNKKYPNKRLLIHYHLPHAPYVGETGMKYYDELPHQYPRYGQRKIDVPDDKLDEAYDENLNIALDYVAEIVDVLEGKTVISSDHGEMLGESDFPLPITLYGHPIGTYTEQLVNVPWFILNYSDRKEIISEENKSEITHSVDTEEIEQRLEDLGYI